MGSISHIDRLRAANQDLDSNELNKTTVIKQDADEIEDFFGIAGKNEETKKREIIVEEKASHVTVTPHSEKKKVGRPKTRKPNETYYQIHINVSESLKNETQKAAICHKTNISAYITSLIENDLKQNGNDYDMIFNTMKKYN